MTTPPEMDPTTAARTWLADHPDDPAAVHVQSALDSADRYEALCQEIGKAEPGKIRVVLATYARNGALVLTLEDRSTEARIAEMVCRMHSLIQTVGRENDRGDG